MAVEINIPLDTNSGLSLPVDNVVVSNIHFPKAILKIELGVLIVTRMVTYDLFNYISKAAIQALDGNVKGGVVEFSGGYEKVMTPAEYAAILADGTLAEVWLKDYLESILGAGTCTIIDPYS